MVLSSVNSNDDDNFSIVVMTPDENCVKVTADKDQHEGKRADTSPIVADAGKKCAESRDDVTAPVEKVIVGLICDTKNLYQKVDIHNQITWTDVSPTDLEEAAENEETQKFAILVRNKKSQDSRKTVEVDSIVIQSPLIKNVLADVLKEYPGVVVNLQRLIFSAPFKPFVHRWDGLKAALRATEYDDQTRNHLQLLHDILLRELRDVLAAKDDYVRNGVVTYDHLWTIFPPKTIVISSRYGSPVALQQMDQGNYSVHTRFGPCFQTRCYRVDWDGTKFGYGNSAQVILPFTGTVPVTELECCPLQYHTDAKTLTAALTERGRRFEALAGYRYKSYKGNAIEQQQMGPARVYVEGRIVIDADTHAKFNAEHQIYVLPLNKKEPERDVQTTDDGCNGGIFGNQDVNDYWFDNPNGRDDPTTLDNVAVTRSVPLTEEQLLLCTPVVRGYSLRSKKWLEFFVDSMTDVRFDEHAFDRLVLPTSHKQLILAFAQNQARNRDRFDDVITGKGRGVIMLLSGGPGIGKTLTAESVAEQMQVPLYVISPGELGTTSSCVEYELARVLEMVARWKAVLLLDECDVFLEARSTDNLERNKIVSIFLRTLEYYEGILFLTTNRVAHMDEAFHSRIHVSLQYPALDEAARRVVWRNFLTHAAANCNPTTKASSANGVVVRSSEVPHSLSDDQITQLARLDLNGRQIKNALKTGSLLASHVKQDLRFEHLKTVLQIEGRMLD